MHASPPLHDSAGPFRRFMTSITSSHLHVQGHPGPCSLQAAGQIAVFQMPAAAPGIGLTGGRGSAPPALWAVGPKPFAARTRMLIRMMAILAGIETGYGDGADPSHRCFCKLQVVVRCGPVVVSVVWMRGGMCDRADGWVCRLPHLKG
jgi:hypothetical protein